MNKLDPKIAIGGCKTFNEQMLNIIPFVDPDSTRFVEWIWAYRHGLGKETHAREFELPSNVHVDMNELKEPVLHMFKTAYVSNKYFRGVRLDSNGDPELLVVVGLANNKPMVIAAGEKDEVEEIIGYYKNKYIAPNVINIHALLGYDVDGSPRVKKNTILENEVVLSKDEFYPWIEEGIDEFVKNYEQSKSSVLVLIGPPGTGKSTFLRTLLFKMKDRRIHMANNENVLLNPNLSYWLEGIPDKPVIAIEDADNLVAARSVNNHQMSMLLNYTDGVINNNPKMIISTNLATTAKIDEALIRKGRAYKILKFRDLSLSEANAARASIGLEALDLKAEERLTLSAALNYSDDDNHDKPKFGFNSSN